MCVCVCVFTIVISSHPNLARSYSGHLLGSSYYGGNYIANKPGMIPRKYRKLALSIAYLLGILGLFLQVTISPSATLLRVAITSPSLGTRAYLFACAFSIASVYVKKKNSFRL